MFNISSFLEKFSKQIKNTEDISQNICQIISLHTNILCTKEMFEIKNNTIFLHTSPAIKNKIFIYKNQILDNISKQVSVKIIDIR